MTELKRPLKLNKSQAAGPDRITYNLLTHLSEQIVPFPEPSMSFTASLGIRTGWACRRTKRLSRIRSTHRRNPRLCGFRAMISGDTHSVGSVVGAIMPWRTILSSMCFTCVDGERFCVVSQNYVHLRSFHAPKSGLVEHVLKNCEEWFLNCRFLHLGRLIWNGST